jgi:hypothetical protein
MIQAPGEKFPPALAICDGLILSPLKGIVELKLLLLTVIDTVHTFKTNCRMTNGALRKGIIMLKRENPNSYIAHPVACGLYYKHMTIVNDDSSVISE